MGTGKDEIVSSHLFQRVASFLLSSIVATAARNPEGVLISFREWLHSYISRIPVETGILGNCSHLFQRVASFLHMISILL